MIAKNLKSVRQRIARCCEKSGRSPEEISLVCVTKEASVDEIGEVLGLGVRDLGENRVQELAAKHKVIGDKAAWHLVGHLQTNKVRDAVKVSTLIHSVDSVKLAKEIDKVAAKLNKVQNVLIQVNPVRNIVSNGVSTSGEAAKFGVSPDEIFGLLNEVSPYRNISIKGLMTIAPEVDNPELVRPFFRKLKELLDRINTKHNAQYTILSMGMTNDFEVAIEEGSNMVRIGRAIFGA
ncbi:MAG: YggS family pyridoxal phosphate-dependent enzyme [Candidatus Omnitrophota bacterium]|nr:YggS family pyridoxal phosphate-dependent enzyme [Candidatus Omnitrophota bacterium]